MKKTLLIFFVFWIASLSAQTFLPDTARWFIDDKRATRTVSAGIGSADLLENYLSPYSYKGWQASLRRENFWRTRFRSEIYAQTVAQMEYLQAKSPAGNHLYRHLLFEAAAGWFKQWKPNDRWTFYAGGKGTGFVGITYAAQNGNNPVQLRLGVQLAASGIVSYDFLFCGRPLQARYQLDLPLLGLAFLPEYGQSYYEISLDENYGRLFRFTSPFNAPSWTQQFSLDVHLPGATMRVGYLSEIRQNHWGAVKAHTWSNVFLLGYVRHFVLLKNKTH